MKSRWWELRWDKTDFLLLIGTFFNVAVSLSQIWDLTPLLSSPSSVQIIRCLLRYFLCLYETHRASCHFCLFYLHSGGHEGNLDLSLVTTQDTLGLLQLSSLVQIQENYRVNKSGTVGATVRKIKLNPSCGHTRHCSTGTSCQNTGAGRAPGSQWSQTTRHHQSQTETCHLCTKP